MQQAPQRVILQAVRSHLGHNCCNSSLSAQLMEGEPLQHNACMHMKLYLSQSQATVLQITQQHHGDISSLAACSTHAHIQLS